MIPLALQQRLNSLRMKAAEESLTFEEMKWATDHLRDSRNAAATQSAPAKRAKAKATVPHADDLLAELGDPE